MDQQVFHLNTDIFEAISSSLEEAKSEILIATAWFTDDQLFNIIQRKIDSGVRVEIILADNEDNRRLPFEKINKGLSKVFRIKNVGFGMMHQKFCVVDKQVVLFGSYNWTINARKNNHESIMRTDQKESVEKFIEIFNEIKKKAEAIAAPSLTGSLISRFKNILHQKSKDEDIITEKGETNSEIVDSNKKDDYSQILDAMIASEINGFDREILHDQGFNKAEVNNGNHNILPKSLDSLYSSFINDIHVVEDKKRRLLAKIEEQKSKKLNQMDIQHAVEENLIESRSRAEEQSLLTTKKHLETEKTKINIEKEDLKKGTISILESEITTLQKNIDESEKSFIKPTINWLLLGVLGVALIALTGYIFIFYSSAAYILLYSTLDANIAKLSGVTLNPPEVFNHEAITKATARGKMALLIILSFPIIPIILSMGSKLVKNKFWGNFISIGLGLFVVDSFVAYKVAEAVHESNYLSGVVEDKWEFMNVFKDSNFYLVFVMGAFGILLFKIVFERIIGMFEDRNPDIVARRSQAISRKAEKRILSKRKEISQLNSKLSELDVKISDLDSEIYLSDIRHSMMPDNLMAEKDHLKLSLNNKKKEIEQISDLYHSHVENDNLPISVDAMKDRISVFLDGWNTFLHKEYSIIKAIEMSSNATGVANEWMSGKIQSNGRENIFKVKANGVEE